MYVYSSISTNILSAFEDKKQNIIFLFHLIFRKSFLNRISKLINLKNLYINRFYRPRVVKYNQSTKVGALVEFNNLLHMCVHV